MILFKTKVPYYIIAIWYLFKKLQKSRLKKKAEEKRRDWDLMNNCSVSVCVSGVTLQK